MNAWQRNGRLKTIPAGKLISAESSPIGRARIRTNGNASRNGRRVAQLRMLIVKLAIRAYQWENNDQLPASLQELVPQYLPDVPIDPFGGKELNYRLEGNKYVLYSCGPDEDDDGGQPTCVSRTAKKSAT